jgi:hypothetical protein
MDCCSFDLVNQAGSIRRSGESIWASPGTPRRNAWSSGPPLELYFEADLSDDDEFPQQIPKPGGYGGRVTHSDDRSGVGGYGGHSTSVKSGKRSITQQTEPMSAVTKNIEELVEAAVAKSLALKSWRLTVSKRKYKRNSGRFIKARSKQYQTASLKVPPQFSLDPRLLL